RAGVFGSFVIIFNFDEEITILPVRTAPPSPDRTPALYGYPLDSSDDSSDEDLSETAKSLHTQIALTLVVHPPPTRSLPTNHIQVAQKKAKIAFENADSSSRVELIPFKDRVCYQVNTYGDTVTLKRHRDNEDKDEEPFARSNRGSKRRRARKEPESTSVPKKKTSKTSGKSTEGSKSHYKTASESAPAEEPMHTTQDLGEPAHHGFETGATNDQHVEEASQHPHWFQKQGKPITPDHAWNKTLPATHGLFVMNRLKVDTLTHELLVGLTYELTKGSCKSLVELEFFLKEVYKATTDQLDWNNPEGHQYPHDLLNPLPLLQRLRQQIMDTLNGLKTWYLVQCGVKHRDDDKLNKFKEEDFKRLHIQDIEDMLLLLVQGKLTNLTVNECFSFNVSLRMFTRSIVIQRRIEDLKLGVKIYQKMLNITKPDTDGTLNDVRTTLDDCLKRIRMQYMPQTIWRRSDKDRAAMIQAIEKQLKTRRIMRSLEKLVCERLYEGNFCLLQRTI
nr:hypothetical protein [Tanacetum cinerariifolium]